jgi:hypothetical protein
VRRGYDRLVQRGEAQVSRLIERGRAEEQHSQALVQTALAKTVDDSIEYLASNQEIQELVEAQSTGLANEIIEELRERSISADIFVEKLARRFVRRPPRSTLPEPPLATRLRAAFASQTKKKANINDLLKTTR